MSTPRAGVAGRAMVSLRGRVARHHRAHVRALAPSARRLDVRLLVPVLLAWPAVGFWGLVVPVARVWPVAGAFTVLAVGLLRWAGWRHRRAPGGGGARSTAAAVLSVTALLLVAAAGHRGILEAGPLDELAAEHAVVRLHGVVTADPRALPAAGRGRGGETGARFVVRVAVDHVVGRGRGADVRSAVLVVGAGAWGRVAWHDEVRLVARLAPAEPGDDVVAFATPVGEPTVTATAGLPYRAAAHVRQRFREASAGLPADARGLVPALVVGDTSATPEELTAAMQATGMSHLSAVSGTNVTVVLAAAGWLCGLLGVRRRARPVVAGLVLVGFVVLARPEPSVVRAAVMGLVGLLALGGARRRVGVPALAGAAVALLAFDPWLARSFGFALSAVATLGLLVLAEPWGRAIGRRLPRRLAGLGPVLAVPLVAQVVCAPVVVPLQGSVTLVGVLANLLAAPFVAPATLVGVVVAVVSVVWVGAAGVVAWGAAVPALAIARVARACATAPGGSVAWGDSAGAAALLALLTLAVLLVLPWAWHRGRARPLAALLSVLGVAAFAGPTAPVAWPPPGWVLVACDVGQGDALVLRSGPGRAVVVDAGPRGARPGRCLDRLGIETVDLVVLTHFHADHVGGLDDVLARPVGQLRTSPVADPPAEAARVARLAAEHHVPVAPLRAGDAFTAGDVTADVWWPARRVEAGSVPNNASVVLTVRVRGVGLLLAGDVERESAAAVATAGLRDPARWGRVDVLKVAHHGSANRDDRLLDLVSGRLALVSVGAGNDYGHPAPSTLRALLSRGFEVHRTDLEGDVAVVTDGTSVRVVHG